MEAATAEETPFDGALRLVAGDQPIASVDDWGRLAPPPGGARAWRDGSSAKALAEAWVGHGRPRVPPEVAATLEAHATTRDMTVASVEPAVRVPLPGVPGGPRAVDLVVGGRAAGGRTLVAVDARVDEPFGETLERTVDNPRLSPRSTVPERLDALCARLFGRPLADPATGDLDPHLAPLRVQLVQGLATTVVAGELTGADQVVHLVHELAAPNPSVRRLAANVDELDRLARALGASPPGPGRLVEVSPVEADVRVLLGRAVARPA